MVGSKVERERERKWLMIARLSCAILYIHIYIIWTLKHTYSLDSRYKALLLHILKYF